MKIHRIKAIIIRHLYLYQRSVPRIMDIFYWPVMDLLVWGFFSVYLQSRDLGNFNVVVVLLGALIFWNFLSHSQRAVSIAFLEDVWERNLLNLFVTPLRVSEFLGATIILGLIKITLISIVMGVLALLFYHFNIFLFGIYLIPFVFNLLLFGWIIGVFVTGIILRFGTSAQVLAFGFIFLIQPFSAVFYPISALPQALQPISYLIPASYVFEGMREVIAFGSFSWAGVGFALLANMAYLVLAIMFFYAMFRRAKKKGALMRLE